MDVFKNLTRTCLDEEGLFLKVLQVGMEGTTDIHIQSLPGQPDA